MSNLLEEINKRFDNLEFRQELGFKKSSKRNSFYQSSDHLDDIAFDYHLNKEQYQDLQNYLYKLTTTTHIFNLYNLKSLKSLVTKEQFEDKIFKIVPDQQGNDEFIHKVARVANIYELLYGRLANQVKNQLNNNQTIEKSVKEIVVNNQEHTTYQMIQSLKQEMNSNISLSNDIVDFLEEQSIVELVRDNEEEVLVRSNQNQEKKVLIEDYEILGKKFNVKEQYTLQLIQRQLRGSNTQDRQLINYLLSTEQGIASQHVMNFERLYKQMENLNSQTTVTLEQLSNLNEQLSGAKQMLESIDQNLEDLKDETE